MVTEKEYLESKKIVDIYESEQLNKHAVSKRSELLIDFIDIHRQGHDEGYIEFLFKIAKSIDSY